jgi:hypothetical protein
MSEQIDPVQYGVLLQKVNTMEKEVSELRRDMHQLLELANKSRGGFWAGMAFVSFLSSLIGFVMAYFGKH